MADTTMELSKFDNTQRLPSILQALNEQRNSSRFCDVILRVCDREIFAHSNVLAAASPYFVSFLGTGQDLPRAFSQKLPQIIEIHIDGNENNAGYGEAVAKVVDFMYTCSINLSPTLITQMMEIAKIMQMDSILEFCSKYQKSIHLLEPVQNSASQSDLFAGGDNQKTPEKIETDEKGVLGESVNSCKNSDVSANAADTQNSECMEDMTDKSPSLHIEDNANFQNDKLEDASSDSEKLDSPQKLLQTPKENLSKPARKRIKKKHFEVEEFEMHSYSEEDAENEENEEIDTGKDLTLLGGEFTALQQRRRSQRRTTFSRMKISRKSSKKSQEQIIQEREERRQLREESEKYLENGMYSCTQCNDYTTGNVYHFRRHLIIHREGKYNCETCGYKASKWKELTDHKKEHLHQIGICSYCNYQSSSQEELEIHMTKHSGNRPFFCNFCDTTFKTKSALQLHFPKHSEDKPYICMTCGAGFKWKHALKNHLVVHSVTKEHLCDVCGFATAHKSQLKSHRLIHTGETFRCEFEGCDFQATKRQNLKYHLLSHTQEKPHQCEICGKSFSLIKNMKRHMLLHTQSRPYQCNMCEFSSTRQDKLREHLLKQHNIGKHCGKKFRITDYNLFQDVQNQKSDEENVSNRSLCTIENNPTVQLIAKTDDGQSIPFTITNFPSVQLTDVNGTSIGFVTQVE